MRLNIIATVYKLRLYSISLITISCSFLTGKGGPRLTNDSFTELETRRLVYKLSQLVRYLPRPTSLVKCENAHQNYIIVLIVPERASMVLLFNFINSLQPCSLDQ